MPPAFNLSQDQTLEFNLASFIAAQSSTRASRRKTRFECGRKPTFVGNLNCPRTPSFDLEGRPSQRRRNAHSTRLKFGVKPPRKKNLKIFRKARFFPPRPRPFGQGPVKRKATYFTQPKTKSKPLDKKNSQCSRSGLFPQNPARQCLPALTPALRTVLRLGQASPWIDFDPFLRRCLTPPQGRREAAIPNCFLFGGKKLGKKQTSRTRDRSIKPSSTKDCGHINLSKGCLIFFLGKHARSVYIKNL